MGSGRDPRAEVERASIHASTGSIPVPGGQADGRTDAVSPFGPEEVFALR